ncbi:hypothetical protein E4U30_006378 [Claviceps sp. LM220 group G6]|nr:hypothetical protein E4U15_006648 [Claviceps sp. LM218 group G6]KAG6091708.1 hypothetical protein E4U30_006378 [Claviceps sp. LM220 group G6]
MSSNKWWLDISASSRLSLLNLTGVTAHDLCSSEHATTWDRFSTLVHLEAATQAGCSNFRADSDMALFLSSKERTEPEQADQDLLDFLEPGAKPCKTPPH